MPAPQVVVLQMQRPELLAEQAPILGEVTWGRALDLRPAMICGAVSAGLALSIRLTVPATTGAAKLLPKRRLWIALPGPCTPLLSSASRPSSPSCAPQAP